MSTKRHSAEPTQMNKQPNALVVNETWPDEDDEAEINVK